MPPEPQSVEWQAHRAELNALTQYKASGKLGYISPEQRQTLNFYWTYSANLTKFALPPSLAKRSSTLRPRPMVRL
ncbi:outer membrane lipoprotein LolB [Vibrio maritimus]|uniref:Outer membrane lipoprotein LolB n=1 Tax=Vibrio maritimus TaxID=990268 RepID=A0A090TED4_9VIBR|nr:outer membrane lipoprotein LolB [Vibrio maritimus]